MDDRRRVNFSKFMSLVLRHQPEKFGLKPDENGFVSLHRLAQVVVSERKSTTYSHALCDIAEAVNKCDKQRYEIQSDKIRARYGHSIEQKIDYTPVAPPEFLFHGTNSAALDYIKKDGLKPMKRQYVHLSISEEIARSVGERHGGFTIILKINSLQAHSEGIVFFNPEPRLWLANSIPYSFIDVNMPETGRFARIANL